MTAQQLKFFRGYPMCGHGRAYLNRHKAKPLRWFLKNAPWEFLRWGLWRLTGAAESRTPGSAAVLRFLNENGFRFPAPVPPRVVNAALALAKHVVPARLKRLRSFERAWIREAARARKEARR